LKRGPGEDFAPEEFSPGSIFMETAAVAAGLNRTEVMPLFLISEVWTGSRVERSLSQADV